MATQNLSIPAMDKESRCRFALKTTVKRKC